MDDKTMALLIECRGWIQDSRLQRPENDKRKRGETKQDHVDRLSMNIELNCTRDDLLDKIAEALGEQEQQFPFTA